MTGQPPPSALPWGWVIEALANFKEVDATTLIGMFNSSPKVTSHVGSNARAMASFRTLERLFDPDTRPIKPVFCASNSGVSFDFSERCEDVLRHILGEMHEPIWDESEKSKWDAQPFIAYKRSCLLKSDLGRLNDTLVEGRPSYLTSLKQMVTSLRLNQPGTRIRDVNGAIFNNQQECPCIDDKVCQDTCNVGNRKGECFDDVKLPGERSTRTGTLNGEDGDEQSSESQSSSDDDLYHKEMNDIAVKKQVFFSTNCKDREVANRWKEAKRCMKCNKGNFNCPFCRYSQSISDYRVVKRKASLARNDLASFNTHERLCVSEQNAIREDKVAVEKNEASIKRDKNNVIRVVNTRCKVNTKGVERAYPLRIYVTEDNDHVSRGEKGKIETDGDAVSVLNKQDFRNAGKECRTEGFKGQQTITQSVHETHAESQMPNGVSNPDLPNERSESSGIEGCNEGSSEQAEYMDRSSRFRKQIKPCTYLHVPKRRRVPVPWTQLEEETLKKWVEKFSGASCIHDRGFPWRKILELGDSEFQRSRKPGDLKDKWRNMQKASRNAR